MRIDDVISAVDAHACGGPGRVIVTVGDTFRHEGVLGTVFEGHVTGTEMVGPYVGIRSSLSGRAWITGKAGYVLDAGDLFPEGYRVGDLWGS